MNPKIEELLDEMTQLEMACLIALLNGDVEWDVSIVAARLDMNRKRFDRLRVICDEITRLAYIEEVEIRAALGQATEAQKEHLRVLREGRES